MAVYPTVPQCPGVDTCPRTSDAVRSVQHGPEAECRHAWDRDLGHGPGLIGQLQIDVLGLSELRRYRLSGENRKYTVVMPLSGRVCMGVWARPEQPFFLESIFTD